MESYIVSFCLNYDRDLIRIFMVVQPFCGLEMKNFPRNF